MTERALILTVAVRGLYPLMLLGSLWILLRGHNAPGGGFIAGMVAVAATAMLAVARGARVAQGRMPLGPKRLAAVSVLVSLGSGLPALFVGQPYMTHLWYSLGHTQAFGELEIELSTVLLFDLGVYGVVWSALGAICAEAIGIDEGEAA